MHRKQNKEKPKESSSCYGPHLCMKCNSSPLRNAGLVIGGIAGCTLGLMARQESDSDSMKVVLESIATGATLGAAVGYQLDQGNNCNCDRCGNKML